MHSFAYAAPRTLREAVSLLAQNGSKARVLAGGTDLLVQMRNKRRQPDLLIDIKQIPEVGEVSFGARRGLRIGAAVPCCRFYQHEDVVRLYPGLVDAAAIIGSIQIQGRASLGGNLCNAAPSADSIPALIVHRAVCEILGPRGRRTVSVEEFCTAPGQTVLQPDELLVAIVVPPPKPRSGAHYLRFIPRREMDIAVAGAAAWVQLADRNRVFASARVALSSVAPTPLFVPPAGDLLTGRPVSPEAIQDAARAAQDAARPISDMRGSAEYRLHLVEVLTRRALDGAVRRARGEHVPNAVEEAADSRGAEQCA